MKIKEIIKNMYCYAATIRAKHEKSTTTAKTLLWANGITEARNLLIAAYGYDSVISLNRVNEDELSEAVPNRTNPKPVPRVLPTAYKDDLIQQALFNQLKRNGLYVQPSVDDLRVAQNDFETEQKHINHEYQKAVKDKQKWSEIRKRRLHKIA